MTINTHFFKLFSRFLYLVVIISCSDSSVLEQLEDKTSPSPVDKKNQTVSEEKNSSEKMENPRLHTDMGKDVQFHDTEHFRFHYTTKGEYRIPTDMDSDNNSIPDLLDMFGKSFEKLWTQYIVEEGWSEPPNDGRVGGGEGLLDIYLKNNTHFATASADKVIGDNPKTTHITEKNAATGYVTFTNMQYLGNVLPSDESMYLVLAAHEFHHVIQYGYFIDSSPEIQWGRWLAEATSTWIESKLYNSLFDRNFNTVFYATDACIVETEPINSGLIEGGSRGYDLALLMEFLENNYGEGAVIELWEKSSENEGFELFDAASENWNTTTKQLFLDFSLALIGRDFSHVERLPSVRLEGKLNTNNTLFFHPNDGVANFGFDLVEIISADEKIKISVSSPHSSIEGYLLGINSVNHKREIYSMMNSATIHPSAYTKLFVIVYNFERINNFTRCISSQYSIHAEPTHENASVPIESIQTEDWFTNMEPPKYTPRINASEYYDFLGEHNESGVAIDLSDIEANRIPTIILDNFEKPVSYMVTKSIDARGLVARDAQNAFALKYYHKSNSAVYYIVSSSPTSYNDPLRAYQKLGYESFVEYIHQGTSLYLEESLGFIILIKDEFLFVLQATDPIKVDDQLKHVALNLLK